MSRELFDMGWRKPIKRTDARRVLAMGFSYYCQAKRFAGFRPRHPVEALLGHLSAAGHAPC